MDKRLCMHRLTEEIEKRGALTHGCTVLHIFVFGTGWSQAQVLVSVGPRGPPIFRVFEGKIWKNLKLRVFLISLIRRIHCRRQWLRAMHIYGLIRKWANFRAFWRSTRLLIG